MIRMEGLPSAGLLTLSGACIGVSSTFSVAQVGELVYPHNGNVAATDSFQLAVNDGAGGTAKRVEARAGSCTATSQTSSMQRAVPPAALFIFGHPRVFLFNLRGGESSFECTHSW